MPYFLGDQVREPAGRLRDKIRHRIDDIARHGPRFLFRAHSPESGGSEKLNAPDVITTRATLNGTSPSSIHDVPVKQLARVVFSHLGWQDCNTLFSSWTQSLQVAVRIARNYSQHEGRQMWISIIDTKRLPSTNTMLYTPALGQVLGTQEMFSDEFLCYGTVAGGAIRSAPYSELEKHGINWLFPSNNLLSDPGKAFSIAVDIAKLFGDRFSLPVATYLLATHVAAMAILAEKPTRENVPVEWFDDPSIVVPGYAHGLIQTCRIQCLQSYVSAS